MFIPVSAIYMLSTHDSENLDKKPGIKYSLVTMQFVFYSQGLLLTLLRAAEPAFFKIIYQKIFLGPKHVTAFLEPLTMRFKSDINSEMVYLILEGISQFSLLTQNKETLDKEQMKRLNKIQY